MKIKRILVSQPKPVDSKSPYYEMAEANNVKLEFRPFIHVEGVTAKDFRKQRVDILAHTGVVFTSKVAIDHYFRLCEELRVSVPDTMHYFCISEQVALYLQKFIVYRKRKIFHATGKFPDLLDLLKKHKDEKFLLPLSNIHKQENLDALDENGLTYTKAFFYNTVSSDLSDINTDDFDAFIFFSPQGIASLGENFPNFVQGEKIIGCFGATTAQAVHDAGLRLDIEAPSPTAPSMPMAIDQFVKKYNKEHKS